MLIETFCGGSFQVNNYVIACEETKTAALIDAGGFGEEDIYKYMDENGYNFEYVLLTHGHLDHVCGSRKIQKDKEIPICLNEEDNFLLTMLEAQLLFYGMPPARPPKNTTNIIDGQALKLGNIKFKVIATPGHSKGSVCFYFSEEKKIFVGDTIFADAIGRTDLPGGSYDTIMKSINEKLLALPDDIEVYSGHGPVTTIGHERVHNPFFGKNATLSN